jgi:hypothetical protein
MNTIYKSILGNSRVTPIGVAIAVGLVIGFQPVQGLWSGVLYVSVLLITLVAAVFEHGA